MAISLGFHIIFAVVGIGLPLMMFIAETLWLRMGEPVYWVIAPPRPWSRSCCSRPWAPAP
jgi:cytochrome d ubiquinol oxidase subunit I